MRSAPRLVAESYDRAATAFAAGADEHVYRLLAAPLVDAITRVGDLGDGAVLDVAAGTGAVGRRFRQPVAVDVSVEQLRLNPACLRVRADGARLPFRDGCFAAAVCGFGINHLAHPEPLVHEMARVATVVGVSTWERPELPYAPKQLVFDLLARRVGHARSEAGVLVDRYTDAVGSVDAVAGVLAGAARHVDVHVAAVEIPWPGVDAYLDYRLSMPTVASAPDPVALRSELTHALAALPAAELTWRPRIIVGVAYR